MTEVYGYSDEFSELSVPFECHVVVQSERVEILYGLEHPLDDRMNMINTSGFYLADENESSLSLMKDE